MEPRLDPAGLDELVAQRRARLLGHAAAALDCPARPGHHRTTLRRHVARGLHRLAEHIERAERADAVPDHPRPHPA
jgi:hypothetical protein